MEVPAFLRNPAILLTAVIGLIALTWFVLGLPVQLPRSPLGNNEKLDCISYSPFRHGEFPAPGFSVPEARIEQDLKKLAPLTSCVRIATPAYGMDRVPALAQKIGMSVILGLAIGRNTEENRIDLDRALPVVDANRQTIRALVVGSGVVSRGDLTQAELAVIIRDVRQRMRLPVTYADDLDTWLRAGEIVGIVEAITVNFSPYAGPRPAAVGDIQQRLRETRAKLAAVYPGKEVVFAESGWPSEGRMRGGARPSRVNQAMAVHEMLYAAKAGNFRLHLHEAFDQPWRMRAEGTAGAKLGLFDATTREPKFQLGTLLRGHPYWFFQIVIGVMCALVAFAAAFFGARMAGPVEIGRIKWLPVAGIGLVSGLLTGEVLIGITPQNQSLFDWSYSAFLVLLVLLVPPVCASAVTKRAPFEGFAVVLDPLSGKLADPLSRVVASCLILVTLVAIELSLGLVFDPKNRDIQYAAMTAPVLSLLIVALANPAGMRRDTKAESAAAILLGAAALFLFFSEGALNWQALWFESLLLVLVWVLAKARGERTI